MDYQYLTKRIDVLSQRFIEHGFRQFFKQKTRHMIKCSIKIINSTSDDNNSSKIFVTFEDLYFGLALLLLGFSLATFAFVSELISGICLNRVN